MFFFLHSEKVNTSCTTNSRLMRYYVPPLERARLALRKSYYFLALHYGRRWTIFPIAETKEISNKGFQMVVSGPLNFKTIHYYFKGLSWLRDIPGDFSFPLLCCFKRLLSFHTPAMSLCLLSFCLKLIFTMFGGTGLQYYNALVWNAFNFYLHQNKNFSNLRYSL